jgi:signal transduction histidine kinase
LTVRVRLTALYTLLFVLCGGAVVAITYGMLAANLNALARAESKASMPAECQDVLINGTSDANLKQKCAYVYAAGLSRGKTVQRDATLSALLRESSLALGAGTVLSALLGWVVAGRALRPVQRITAAARAASEHDLTARVALSGPRDELRELADTFDIMLARLETSFEGQRRFIANASHELRTPLTVMRTTVDVVLGKPAPTPDELLRMGRDVRAAVNRAEALTDALLTLARTDRGLIRREPVDLATVVEDVTDSTGAGVVGAGSAGLASASAGLASAGLASASAGVASAGLASASAGVASAGAGDCRVHMALSPAPVSGDPVLLERLVANLLDNALRYNVPQGRVWLDTSTVDGQAVLVVRNTGPVVEPVDGLFEPFRRLRDRVGGDGFGLGLTIVASIAGAHGGTVAADPLGTGGLRVTVSLPYQPA